MKTSDRLKAIDNSRESWRASLSRVPPDDVTLIRLIRVASQGITAFTDPMLLEAGLTESSYHSLIVIAAGGDKGITVTAVCDQVGQARANMTRILKLLEAAQLTKMHSDDRDARRKRVVATAKGRRLVRTCSERLDPVVVTAFSALGDREKRSLDELLRKLIASMSEAESEAQRRA
ncbi:MAG: MarR family winged helix-turn-helix transcriptional regulator [Sinimarinibacterium flocculans]|uniref:MarR family winged helix-turn-helix transcriptional regulator n=1 Tax=Sinimarinibacterium flocculans TaxID=985250 RepID=UPI003C5F0411